MGHHPLPHDGFSSLQAAVLACTQCSDLPLGPKPILQLDVRARILIAGQAPGRRAHESGIPFDDVSGDTLRQWLGVDRAAFYDPALFAILPMGFCYPGTGRSGDLPPRAACAPHWRSRLLANLPSLQLTLVIGRYALDWHFADQRGTSVTDLVARWQTFLPRHLPMPHPSPRNLGWRRRNPWFERDLVPALQDRVAQIRAARNEESESRATGQ